MQSFGQCEERIYFQEDFTANGLPACWANFQSPNGSNFHAIGGRLQTHQANVINSRYVITHHVVVGNGQGFFTFDAQGVGGQTAVEIGVVDTNLDVSTYDSIQEVNITSEMETYTVDLTSYSGTGKYLVIREDGTSAFQAIYMDNFKFTPSPLIEASICSGAVYQVGDSSYSESGLYVTTLKDTQNNDSLVSINLTVNPLPEIVASTSKDKVCLGDSVLFSAFGADVYSWSGNVVAGEYFFPSIGGEYIVTGTSTETACAAQDTVTIAISHIEQVGITGSDTICSGTTLTVELDSTVTGLSYQLRNDANNQFVGNTLTGNGSAQSFTLPALIESANYHVLATGSVGTESSNALHFPGVNTSEVVTSTPNTATNALTIEAWVNVEVGGLGTLVSNVPTTAFSNALGLISLHVWGNGDVYFAIGLNGSTQFTQLNLFGVVNPNEWVHVAATFSSSAMKVFINGVEAGSLSLSNKTIGSSANMFNIGRQFSGKVDDVRIWNTTKTAQQIAASMNNCLSGAESGLRAYFDLEEADGSTVKNAVDNSDAALSANDIMWISGSPVTCSSGCAVELSGAVFAEVANLDTTVSLNVETISVYDGIPVPANTTFQWLDCGNSNSPIVDAVNTDFTAGNSGSYACEISQGNCTVSTSCHQVVISSLNAASASQLLVLPNPTNSFLSFNTEETIQKVVVTNTAGIEQYINMRETNLIDVSGLSDGIYIIHVYTLNHILNTQFVKE